MIQFDFFSIYTCIVIARVSLSPYPFSSVAWRWGTERIRLKICEWPSLFSPKNNESKVQSSHRGT